MRLAIVISRDGVQGTINVAYMTTFKANNKPPSSFFPYMWLSVDPAPKESNLDPLPPTRASQIPIGEWVNLRTLHTIKSSDVCCHGL